MIVFTLDALADDSHRRHLIDPLKNLDFRIVQQYSDGSAYLHDSSSPELYHWQPDWQAYHDACEGDVPIMPVISTLRSLWSIHDYNVIEIWSDRPESYWNKTYEWTMKQGILKGPLKMRPIGDDRPQEELLEEWLITNSVDSGSKLVDMVFSSHKPTIDMFRRRGVFVFDCNQGE